MPSGIHGRPPRTRPGGRLEGVDSPRKPPAPDPPVGGASDICGPEPDRPDRRGPRDPRGPPQTPRPGRESTMHAHDWSKTVVGAPTRLVRREGSCAPSALYLTRRNDLLTMVPGVTPERRERPPKTASPPAWSAATTGRNDKRVPMPLSRFKKGLTFRTSRRYDRQSSVISTGRPWLEKETAPCQRLVG